MEWCGGRGGARVVGLTEERVSTTSDVVLAFQRVRAAATSSGGHLVAVVTLHEVPAHAASPGWAGPRRRAKAVGGSDTSALASLVCLECWMAVDWALTGAPLAELSALLAEIPLQGQAGAKSPPGPAATAEGGATAVDMLLRQLLRAYLTPAQALHLLVCLPPGAATTVHGPLVRLAAQVGGPRILAGCRAVYRATGPPRCSYRGHAAESAQARPATACPSCLAVHRPPFPSPLPPLSPRPARPRPRNSRPADSDPSR